MVRCSSGHENDAGKRYCGECGEALVGTATPQIDGKRKTHPLVLILLVVVIVVAVWSAASGYFGTQHKLQNDQQQVLCSAQPNGCP